MKTHSDDQTKANEFNGLKYLNFFRLFLALLFFIVLFKHNKGLEFSQFILTSPARVFTVVYLIYSIVMVLIFSTFYKDKKKLGVFALLIDLPILMFLTYSENYIQTGWAILPILVIGSFALLSNKSNKVMYLPLAASILLWVVPQIFPENPNNIDDVTKLLFTTIYFLIAFIGARQSDNYTKSLLINKKQKQEIRWLARINAMIIEEMNSGIVAYDKNYKTILLNENARQILKTNKKELLPEKIIKTIIANQHSKKGVLNLFGEEVYINIVNPSKNINLLFLERQSEIITKAQQANLATIGQLSATVAHELRNPMSAIYSASQLLLESPELPEQDYDLADIISKQIERANRIIEEILLMSKHHDATKIKIEIVSYIKKLKQKFCEQEQILSEDFIEPEIDHKVYIDFDINMFRQIVWNLVSNAIKHGETGKVEVDIVELEEEILIDFKNEGEEFEPAIEEGLFTPFYTTHNQGTGLGLFICREMCNANQAKLDYLHQDFKHVFRIHVPKK